MKRISIWIFLALMVLGTAIALPAIIRAAPPTP
jgi:hypothetical protein